MPNTQNVAQVKDLEEKASKAKSVVLVNYSGLTVKQQTTLRSKIREAGGEMLVAKNTLVQLALKSDEEFNKNLEGQTAVVFSYTDEIAPLKAIVDFAKTNEKPELKVGLLEKKFLSLAALKELAQLPGKDQLIATLISRIQGPAYGLVNVIQASTRNLVYALEAIRKQKETA